MRKIMFTRLARAAGSALSGKASGLPLRINDFGSNRLKRFKRAELVLTPHPRVADHGRDNDRGKAGLVVILAAPTCAVHRSANQYPLSDEMGSHLEDSRSEVPDQAQVFVPLLYARDLTGHAGRNSLL